MLERRRKFARPRSHRPTTRAMAFAVALPAAFTAGGARADEPSPYFIGVTQALTHDSNVFRIADSVPIAGDRKRSDTYSSTGLIGGFDQSIGRQRVHGSGNVRYNKYFDNGSLDNTSYGVDAGLDWATIAQLSGSVFASASQGLATQNGNSISTGTQRNLLRTDQIGTSVVWGGAGRISLRADYAHSDVKYSSDGVQNSDSSGDTASIGGFYEVNPTLQVGIAYRYTRSRVPNGFLTGPGTFASNDTNGRNIDLLANWRPTALTGVNARLSFTNQSSGSGGGQDFSGITGSLSGTYQLTAKTGLSASYSRDAGTNGVFFNSIGTSTSPAVNGYYNNSTTTDAVTLGVNYAATAKISANAGATYRRARISNAGATGTTTDGTTTDGNYNDSYRSVSLGATYAIARAWSLSCNALHESRSVTTIADNNYTANVIGCSVQLTLR